MRVKYNILNSITGVEEPWTGLFMVSKEADTWYNKYGVEWEKQGKKLVRVEFEDLVKQNEDIKVSFDFDGTLGEYKLVREYAKELVKRGYDVHIVTRRFDTLDKYTKEFCIEYDIKDVVNEHNYLFEVAEDIGIPEDNIHFLNMTDKWIFFKDNPGFVWHLDDDSIEIKDINENKCGTIGLSCLGNTNWMHKGDKFLELYKFNNAK